jgi:cytochrome c-type biogenesis protein CcmH
LLRLPRALSVPRALAAALALCALTVGLGAPAAATAAPRPRTTLLNVEGSLMCVACKEPLAEPDSPEAQRERQVVQQLIAKGYTKQQIIKAMVAQYGTAVLAKPPARGLNLTIYVIPPAIVAAGVLFLLVTLPRWRRRAREAAITPMVNAPAISAADARRLEQDLAQFE